MIEPSIRLRRAIHQNRPLLVRRILRSHPGLVHNPDSSPQGGGSNSSLHLAALLGHADVCRELLAAGHELPTPALNEAHQTALMLASGAGHTDVVHLLAMHDPTCILRRDGRGRDAIMDASRAGHDTCLQILLTAVPCGPAAAVRRADVDGNTAIHFASGFGHMPVLRTLLAAGADPAVENAWSWTPAAYSATVQTEVYLKGLMAERERGARQAAAAAGSRTGRHMAAGENTGGTPTTPTTISAAAPASAAASAATPATPGAVRLVMDDEA